MAGEAFGAIAGGLAAGMAPWMQRMMYAKALQNAGNNTGSDSGWKDTTGQGATVPPSASWWQRNMPTFLGGASPSGALQTQPVAPATPGAPGLANWGTPVPGMTMVGGANVQPPSTGTTQGHPLPTPTPPIPPGSPAFSAQYPATPPTFGAGMPGPVVARPSLSSQQFARPYPIQGFPSSGAAPAWSPLDSIYQPGSTNFGTFGRIT